MSVFEDLQALHKKRPKIDWDLIKENKDHISEAISEHVTMTNIFQVMRKNGFKGDYSKFVRYLEELGIWKIGCKKQARRKIEHQNTSHERQNSTPQPSSNPSGGYKKWGKADVEAPMPVDTETKKSPFSPGVQF